MFDMLVKLYDLPAVEPSIQGSKGTGGRCPSCDVLRKIRGDQMGRRQICR